MTSVFSIEPSVAQAYQSLPSTVTLPKTTIYYPCNYAREAEAAAEPEAQPEEGDTLAKRQLIPAVLALAADKISKGCECFGLTTKTVTKTNYEITVSFLWPG